MRSATDFSPAGYERLLSALVDRGYGLRGWDDVEPAEPHLILRHDVDFDLGAAVAMAELEAARGWHAHYFVLLRTDLYNPFSGGGQHLVRRLIALGHQVGLHFDASLYAADLGVLSAAVEAECGMLEGIAGAPVISFSLHRPARATLDRGFAVTGRTNAYAPRFVQDIGYCSDSRGGWHYGHPLEHNAVQARTALQLLVHPLWWMDGGGDVQGTVARVLDRHHAHLEREAARNCTVYAPRLGTPR